MEVDKYETLEEIGMALDRPLKTSANLQQGAGLLESSRRFDVKPMARYGLMTPMSDPAIFD